MAKYSDGNGFAEYIDNGIGVGLYKKQDLIGLGIFSSENNLYLAHALNNHMILFTFQVKVNLSFKKFKYWKI